MSNIRSATPNYADCFEAAWSFISLTGMNPNLVCGLKLGTMKIESLRRPAARSLGRSAGKQPPKIDQQADHRRAFSKYLNHHRPKIVNLLKAQGRRVPDSLFLTDNGKPMTVERLQQAFIRRNSRQRFQEIVALTPAAHCVRPIRVDGESGPWFPHSGVSKTQNREAYLPAIPTSLEPYLSAIWASLRHPTEQRSHRRNAEK